MTRTLVAYAGKHGSTEEVAVRVAQRLCDRGHGRSTRMPASDARDWQAIDAWADAVAALAKDAGDTSKRGNLVRAFRTVADAGLALSRSRG